MTEISYSEKIIACIRYWKDFFQMFFSVRKTFQNPIGILFKSFKNDFPINATLKNGNKIQLQTFNAIFFISHIPKSQQINYDVAKDIVVLYPEGESIRKEIIFHGGVNNGDIVYIFFKKNYDGISVKNKTVLDIGANIGDTAIFYALSGAERVIGIEPFPKNFQLAKENINANKLDEVIELLQAGCSSKEGIIKIDPKYQSNIESKIRDFENGIDVHILTLKEIVDRFKIPFDSILKIDCEGCEYDIIENTPTEILSQFSSIQIEYHSGFHDLKHKLESIGYNVKVTKPHATDVINSLFNFKSKGYNSSSEKINHKIGYSGFIIAFRNNEFTFS